MASATASGKRGIAKVVDRRCLILLPLLLAGGRASQDPATELAGRYYRQFPDALVNGGRYVGQDVVEIVPVATGAAYVRLHLDYYNGHICALSGVAQTSGGALVYDDAGRGGDHCVLTVRRSGQSLVLDDSEGRCSAYCGARGSLSDVRIPYASKRPIGYLARLKSSSEYQDAVALWRKEKQ